MHNANYAENRGYSTGAVRVGTCCRQECFRWCVCAAKEAGDNGLIKLAEDGNEQFWTPSRMASGQVVDVPVIMLRRPGVLRSAHRVR